MSINTLGSAGLPHFYFKNTHVGLHIRKVILYHLVCAWRPKKFRSKQDFYFEFVQPFLKTGHFHDMATQMVGQWNALNMQAKRKIS